MTGLTNRRRVTRRVSAAATLLAVVGLSACDSLMEVTLPGNLTTEDLTDPALAPMFVATAEGQFDCMYVNYIYTFGLFTQQLLTGATGAPTRSLAARGDIYLDAPASDCGSSTSVWLPINIARVEAEKAVTRIEGFKTAGITVPNAEFLIGKAHAYAGYNYLLAAEAFCELAWDGGAAVTREATFGTAVTKFTAALASLQGVTGANATEAASLRNMALVGRARANLNLGKTAEVLTDARAVTAGFARQARYSDATGRLYNKIHNELERSRQTGVSQEWQNLTVDGVPDPRVPLFRYGTGVAFDVFLDVWGQRKYNSLSAPINIASWREAQLMIAEVSGGQTAVDIINTLRATYSLPRFSSTDATQIRDQVREERRRELFLEGTRIGDKLRWKEPWVQGLDGRGTQYHPRTCMPMIAQEKIGNPNL